MWTANGKPTTLLLSPQTVLSKTEKNERCFLWRQNNPDVNYFSI
jgi:hypothetical protein